MEKKKAVLTIGQTWVKLDALNTRQHGHNNKMWSTYSSYQFLFIVVMYLFVYHNCIFISQYLPMIFIL